MVFFVGVFALPLAICCTQKVTFRVQNEHIKNQLTQGQGAHKGGFGAIKLLNCPKWFLGASLNIVLP